MRQKCGLQYHRVIELFRRFKLPVFEGLQAELEAFNKRRMAELHRKKTEKYELRVEGWMQNIAKSGQRSTATILMVVRDEGDRTTSRR